MAVTTKKQFPATTNATTTVFSPVSIQLNNQDDLDVYVTLSGGTRVLQLRQSTGSTAQSSHPQVNNTDGLYFPAVSAGTTLYNYTLSSDNNTITFNSALPQGAVVFCERRTRDADSAYTSFASGSTIRATDLNNSSTESNFTAQDARNKALDLENSIFGGVQPTINGVPQPFINSSNIIDGSIATVDIADDAITTAKIANDAITEAKLGDNAVRTNHIFDGQVTTSKIADTAVTTAKIADANVTTAKLQNGAVNHHKIEDLNVTTAKIAADAVNSTKIADDSINSEHYVDGSIDTAHIGDAQITTAKIADANVTTAKIAADAVNGTKIADDSINSEHYVDGSIDTAHIADSQVTTAKIADANITAAKIASNAVTTDKIADGELTTLAGMQSGTASKLASSTTLTADIADLNQIDGMAKQTTITDDDTKFPTSGAIVDYVAAQLEPFGGFEAIANESSFPNTQPVSGVAISIADAGGMAVSNTGTASGTTVGGTTVNISGIPSNFHGASVATGVRFIVVSTGSSQNYTYHKATLKEDDLVQLSGDINDFSERYRVGSSNPTSSLDSGDLFFNTNTGKLLVYNGTNSAWEEAQSIGNFFISTLSPAFDGTTQNFTITNAPTNAEQILLVINGVVQKPNAGSSVPSEGFALDGSTIKLGAAPATGSTYHAVVIGSTVNIGTPSNNTVTTAILQNGSVTTAKIVDANVTTAKITDANVTTAKIADSNVTTAKIADDAVTNAKMANNAVDDAVIAALAVTTPKIADDAVTAAKLANTSVTAGSYGSSTSIPSITVDAQGRITAASTSSIDSTSIANGTSSVSVANNGNITANRSGTNRLVVDGGGIVVTGVVGATDRIDATNTLNVTGTEGTSAVLKLVADQGDDNGDGWRIISNQDDNDLTFSNNISGSYADKLTLKNNGNLDVTGGVDVTGNITCTGTIPAAQLTGTLPAIDGSNLTGITSTTINNNANNRIITGSGTANTLEGESTLTFDGTNLLFGAGRSLRFTSGGGWSGNSAMKIEGHNNYLYLCGGTSGMIFRDTGGTDQWGISSSGHFLPQSNNTYDIGNSSYRVRNIYTNDLHLSNEGSSNDVDGTWGDWTIQEGESDLFLKNNRSGKKYKFNLTEVS